MRIYFEANDDTEDATLIINTPDGSWIGNDDAFEGTLNPMLDLNRYGSGTYDIWVGSYEKGTEISGTLVITELHNLIPGSTFSTESLDFSLEPTYGFVNLTAGFEPDPYQVPIVSGGPVNVSNLNLCGDCEGYAASQPDFRLNWSGSSADLKIYFEADNSTEDATLIINTPDGSWIGNDDAGIETLNPLLSLAPHGSGTYDIWVGSYEQGENISGTLYITELNSTIPVITANQSLDFSLEPVFSTVNLSEGFNEDPKILEIVSGGPVNVSNLNLCNDCVGFASASPDVRLVWTGESNDLVIFFEADNALDDATMIINTPDGRWIGNDDTNSNTLNPMLNLRNYGQGTYDIWVGSLNENDNIIGKLTITERNLSPR
ncbi:MAG: hypothetical protein EA412_07095 [Chitinophagaceae bacterium]|nr:MAG: hypothetical protein EA412_07095 [Chitinophagaceae bacterium]